MASPLGNSISTNNSRTQSNSSTESLVQRNGLGQNTWDYVNDPSLKKIMQEQVKNLKKYDELAAKFVYVSDMQEDVQKNEEVFKNLSKEERNNEKISFESEIIKSINEKAASIKSLDKDHPLVKFYTQLIESEEGINKNDEIEKYFDELMSDKNHRVIFIARIAFSFLQGEHEVFNFYDADKILKFINDYTIEKYNSCQNDENLDLKQLAYLALIQNAFGSNKQYSPANDKIIEFLNREFLETEPENINENVQERDDDNEEEKIDNSLDQANHTYDIGVLIGSIIDKHAEKQYEKNNTTIKLESDVDLEKDTKIENSSQNCIGDFFACISNAFKKK